MSIILRVGAVKSSRAHETHYGSGDEASSYTDADVLDIPLPEHTYQRPYPPPSTHTQCSTGYFGLPYQDHNYGMPPPPSPSRPATPRPPSPLQVNGVVQMEEEVKTTPFVSVVEEVVEDSITRCICGYLHDDGYMICCDRCSVWQHIDCMGVDRNNIPESYFCELCQPRTLDAQKAKVLQKRKREELAARNVLSDSSATDTDPEEATNALASMGKKLPNCKKKSLKQKRSSPKVKDKQSPFKLKIEKGLAHKKINKPGKKEKENIKTAKPKKLFKTGSQKLKPGKSKIRPLLTLEQLSGDPWNSNLSPWVDSYEFAHENHYSPAVRGTHLIGQSVDISIVSDQLLTQVTCVADVKKNRKGLRATQEIPAGQAIIEYRGKVLLQHDYDKEYAFDNSFKKLQPFVLFYSQLNVDLCVDARVYGNEARFVRRSCSPNAEVQHILSQGKVYFVIVSKKSIQVGAEITIPFDYNYENCSYFVECACGKSNCVVSKYWKRLKNVQKSSSVDVSMRRKRQPSTREGSKSSLDDRFSSSTSQGSPTKSSESPVKSLQMKITPSASPHPPVSSPVKFSNVCTLLAASALLDGKLDSSSLQLDTTESLPQAPPPPPTPPLPPPKSTASSRRGSRLSEDSSKEEKPAVIPAVHVKEKHKTKEQKPKEKDVKDHPHVEVKKERRPSSRRQSHEDIEELVEVKSELPVSAGVESDDAGSTSECPRKLTREERKLDAIMKAFEKMEKREERKKEAMARGDTIPKKCPSGEAKVKKKDETDSSSGCGASVNSCPATVLDGPVEGEETVKAEVVAAATTTTTTTSVVEHQEMKSPTAGEVKLETTTTITAAVGGVNAVDFAGKHCTGTAYSPATSTAITDTQGTIKEESQSPQKSVRKLGKRKRRRSRVQSTTTLSDAASVSTDEGNSNSSFPVVPLSVPAIPALTPVSTFLPLAADMDAGLFKYIKTKKHLFEEWSSKQEDEASKHEEEMFVEYLPNPHVNTMDHLQRRHSHGAGCSTKGAESSVGSAKKRWLRQAMHEVPVPVAFNHSLSVNTDSGGGSPVHGGASPNPGTVCMGSPVAASPIDFVTPLKKRRLMRESVSSETSGPVGSAVMTEGLASNSVGITPKTNGVKQFYPVHRHSTDDRLLLHKGYPHQNGYREVVTLNDSSRRFEAAVNTHTLLSSSPTHSEFSDLELSCADPEQTSEHLAHPAVDPVPVSISFPHISAVSEAVPESPMKRSSHYALKFRGHFARMEVNCNDEASKGGKIQPAASSSSSSRLEENDVCVSRSSIHGYEDDTRIDSSASVTTVVVVNSSVYSGVNSLMDEGSEAGCVTAKSIMDIDSPATVCVDLNAHEMEPSLSDGNAVVTLDDRLFNRNSSRDVRTFEVPSECQVNSSEDVALPLVTVDHSSEIFDVCTGSTGTHFLRVGIGNHSVAYDNEQEQETVDSSQHVNRKCVNEFVAVLEEQGTAQEQPGTSSGIQTYTDCISSSGQASSSAAESMLERSGIICDSIEEASENESEVCVVSRQCDADVGEVRAPAVGFDEATVDDEAARTCDSVGGNVPLQQPSTCRAAVGNDYEEEVGDSAVSESHCPDQTFFVSGSDSNVDSTSSEVNRGSIHQCLYTSVSRRETPDGESVAVEGCCDSNYERLPNGDAVYDSSVTGDESSLEGLCVSSSNVTDMQSGSTWESYSKLFPSEAVPDYSVSTAEPDHGSGQSQSTSTTSEASSMLAPATEHVDCNLEVGTSSSEAGGSVSCSSQSFSQSVVSSPTSAPSSVISADGALSSTFPSPSSGQLTMTSSSTATTAASQTATTSPPTLSTAEAAPAGKKKVSLLEYRKRLKDKPAIPGAPDVKTSLTVPASSSSSTPHKLSPTLSMYLASSPTSSASSTSPSKSPSSSNHHHQKKHEMPTLATLPLFKDADPKREENKKKHRPKPEKQLSLTDRLRLEFGLEDYAEDSSKKKGEELEVASTNGGMDDSVPPPPPPLPPTAGSNYPPLAAAASSFVTPSTHPQTSFHGSQAPLVNGGTGSYYGYQQQQQPCISSTTTLSTPPPSQGNNSGGRDRQVPRFSGHAGPGEPAHYQPHLQQQQPSPASHLNPPAQAWTGNQGPLPPSPSSSHHIHPPQQYEYNHWQPAAQLQTVHSDNNISEDHPPPPPPPPPRPPHHRHSVVSSSSSSLSSHHRHHHNHSSGGKSIKAASSSSSSSSHYSENRNRH